MYIGSSLLKILYLSLINFSKFFFILKVALSAAAAFKSVVEEAAYLGCDLNQDTNMLREIKKRMAKCEALLQKMHIWDFRLLKSVHLIVDRFSFLENTILHHYKNLLFSLPNSLLDSFLED